MSVRTYGIRSPYSLCLIKGRGRGRGGDDDCEEGWEEGFGVMWSATERKILSVKQFLSKGRKS